jgi:hypothetical protein
MTARGQLWSVIAAGTAIRLVLGFGWVGSEFDMRSYELVSDALVHSPLDVYSPQARWPYPPAFLPVVVLLDQLAQASGIALHSLIHLPLIAADAAIAWLVHRFLLGRGAGERRALAGAALVALGPSFIAISGFHGQFDSVAVLPALLALVLWQEGRSDRRAVQAGLLVGLAAALKTPMALMLFALLPTADLRQSVRLAVPAAAVPLLLLAPFLVTDLRDVVEAVSYNGVAGIGGLGLLVQPDLLRDRLGGTHPVFSPAALRLEEVAPLIALGAVLCAAAFLRARRAAVLTAAAVLWLTVYVLGINFAFQYLVWGLPVFIMAGALGWVAAAQVVAGVATVLLYAGGPHDGVVAAYLVAINLLLAGAAVALAAGLRRVHRGGAPP